MVFQRVSHALLRALVVFAVAVHVVSNANAVDWIWYHDELTDGSYNNAGSVGVSEFQSSSIGFPAIAYVARDAPSSYPYNFAVKVQIGGSVTTLKSYTNTTSVGYAVLGSPSISLHPNGEAYVAWPEFKLSSSERYLKIYYCHRDSGGTWTSPALLATPISSFPSFRWAIESFSVQIYDDERYAWGGSWWWQANNDLQPFEFYYKLNMNGTLILDESGSYYDSEDYYPALVGPAPFNYKAGTSASSPDSLVYNKVGSYDPYSGWPSGYTLTVFSVDSGIVDEESAINSGYTPHFALVTTNADKRHIIFQHTGPSPGNTLSIDCATSSSLGSWSTHDVTVPVLDPWGWVTSLGRPISAVADPSANSDAFGVFCWTPENYDPNVAWVLEHSSGTDYVTNVICYDTSTVLLAQYGKESIGRTEGGESLTHIFTSSTGSELAVD